MATNITRSFKLYGWCSRIRGVESGGAVEELPAHTFPTDDGGVDMKCPTEIAIADRREAELAKNGFMPLMCTARIPTWRPLSEPSRCTSRRSTMIRTPRPMPIWAPACPISSRPAGLRTT